MCNARLYRFWSDLGPALKTGQPQNEVKHSQKAVFETLYQDLPRLEQFMGAMRGISMENFQVDTAVQNFCGAQGAVGQRR
jgi:hypothetical protein